MSNYYLDFGVCEKLKNATKECFLYVSHEYKGHFYPGSLQALTKQDFTVRHVRAWRGNLWLCADAAHGLIHLK